MTNAASSPPRSQAQSVGKKERGTNAVSFWSLVIGHWSLVIAIWSFQLPRRHFEQRMRHQGETVDAAVKSLCHTEDDVLGCRRAVGQFRDAEVHRQRLAGLIDELGVVRVGDGDPAVQL